MTQIERHTMPFVTAAVLVTIAFSPVTYLGRAQEPKTEPAASVPPTFDVASVKPISKPAPLHGATLNFNHGTLRLEADTLQQIVALAFGIQRLRVLGGPGWIESEQFDIIAKTGDLDANRDQVRVMLQAVLADRFKLTAHKEMHTASVYALVVGKGGPKMKEARDDEPAGSKTGASGGMLQVAFQKVTVLGLVNTLANILDSPVLDETGLKGYYDYKLEWAATRMGQENPGQVHANDSGPDLFIALQEQLGLNLVKKKGSIEFLVIDHAERPEN